MNSFNEALLAGAAAGTAVAYMLSVRRRNTWSKRQEARQVEEHATHMQILRTQAKQAEVALQHQEVALKAEQKKSENIGFGV